MKIYPWLVTFFLTPFFLFKEKIDVLPEKKMNLKHQLSFSYSVSEEKNELEIIVKFQCYQNKI